MIDEPDGAKAEYLKRRSVVVPTLEWRSSFADLRDCPSCGKSMPALICAVKVGTNVVSTWYGWACAECGQ